MWKPTLPPFAKYKKESLRKQEKVAGFIYQIGEYPDLRQRSKPVDIKSYKNRITRRKFDI